MGLNALKCIQIYISQKRPTNGNKWQKMAEISEITKYGDKMRKMRKIHKNVK